MLSGEHVESNMAKYPPKRTYHVTARAAGFPTEHYEVQSAYSANSVEEDVRAGYRTRHRVPLFDGPSIDVKAVEADA